MRRQDGRWETYVDHVLDFAPDRVRPARKSPLVTLVLVEGASSRSPGDQMVSIRSVRDAVFELGAGNRQMLKHGGRSVARH
jgi:hypothetical protein